MYIRFCANAGACKLCYAEILRPNQFNGLMLTDVRFPTLTSTGQV